MTVETSVWQAIPDVLSLLSSVVTIIGFPLAIIGLIAVAQQMRNDRLSVSAGAVADMRSSILQRIESLSNAGAKVKTKAGLDHWDIEFRELMNEVELACAIYLDGQMSGRSGELARQMLVDVLQIVERNPDLSTAFQNAIHTPHTFTNIRDFKTRQGLAPWSETPA